MSDKNQTANSPDASPASGNPRTNGNHPVLALPGDSVSSIRRATLRDLSFVLELQRKFSNQIGFIPRVGSEWYVDSGNVKIVLENGDPAGMLLGRQQYRWQPLLRPIFQAAICFDAQRRHHGLALLERLKLEAIAAGQIGIQCCCREGLEANEFWKAAGFVPVCYMTPETARKRDVICWRLPLVKRLPLWFASPPPVAGWKARKV